MDLFNDEYGGLYPLKMTVSRDNEGIYALVHYVGKLMQVVFYCICTRFQADDSFHKMSYSPVFNIYVDHL